jgi:hypothetical protein
MKNYKPLLRSDVMADTVLDVCAKSGEAVHGQIAAEHPQKFTNADLALPARDQAWHQRQGSSGSSSLSE